MITELDKAWAAGFFEGEGSVHISRSKSTHGFLMLEIAQVDRAPLDWINERWPGTINSTQPKTIGSRPFFRWVRQSGAAVRFLQDIRPFVVRPLIRTKIDLAAEFQASKLRTHANRQATYREQQAAFITLMAYLNRRGVAEVERAALSTRVNAA